MAWTNVGFDGTINEAQWSQMSTLMGSSGGGYLAAGNGDCLVTAVPGARSVSVAAGSLYGDGVVSTNSGAETVAMTTPVNGQWYVIALRRTWATNTAALVAIAGATTTTTTPTAPPTSFPTLNTNQGVLTDQPIAWAWCNSANTTVVVYDIRLKGTKSTPPVVANANERDAKFMTPTQGLQVWRDDLGAVETYFGLYNSSTNPGGRDTAGWYVTNRSSGIVPIIPTSVNFSGGGATINAIGQVGFGSTAYVSLNGVFTSKYSRYRVIIAGAYSSGAVQWNVRLRTSGVDNTATNYVSTWQKNKSAITLANGAFTYYPIFETSSGYNYGSAIIDIQSPTQSVRSTVISSGVGYDGSVNTGYLTHGMYATTTNFDGISIIASSGTIGGSVIVYGWNE